MGVNQQVFERYVNGDETALMGMPVQKQIKFRELRNVLSRFFGDYPERMKPEFAIALIDDQCFLMDKCNRAIEELDAEKLYKLLNERKEHDLTLRAISDNYLTSLDDDSVGNRYDEKQDRKTKLEKKLHSGALRDYVEDYYNGEVPEQPTVEYKIARTKKVPVKPMHIEEAILQMDMLGHQFYMFRDAETEEIAVVYKRHNGGYGLLEPNEDDE